MPKNFMEAGTEIDDCVGKINQCLKKTANSLADACVNRASNGNVGKNMSQEILNLIKDLPVEYQTTVLAMTISTMASHYAGGGRKPSNNKGNLHTDYFSSRGL
jgi:hypothetical protein